MDYASKEGYVTTYYGTYNIYKPRKDKVHYHMMEEHIRQSIEKEKEVFRLEINKILIDFSKAMNNKLDEDKFSRMATTTKKLLNEVIKLNDLVRPSTKPRVYPDKKSLVEELEIDEFGEDDEL